MTTDAALFGVEWHRRSASTPRGWPRHRAGRLARPAGFVAPAWLFNRHLAPALVRRRFRFTEDHRSVHALEHDVAIDCPVITRSAHTEIRRHLSRVVARSLAHRWRRLKAIRVAIHPADLDHPSMVDSIAEVIRIARRDRDAASYDELLARPGEWRLIAGAPSFNPPEAH